jgi:hypothetical protein
MGCIAMSDAETNVLDYLRRQFARMDNRFDSIERKLDELLAIALRIECDNRPAEWLDLAETLAESGDLWALEERE